MKKIITFLTIAIVAVVITSCSNALQKEVDAFNDALPKEIQKGMTITKLAINGEYLDMVVECDEATYTDMSVLPDKQFRDNILSHFDPTLRELCVKDQKGLKVIIKNAENNFTKAYTVPLSDLANAKSPADPKAAK